MMNTLIYYTLPDIYGIKIGSYTDNIYAILFEQKYDTIMTNEMIKEAKEFYENLDENTKNNIKIQTYRRCKCIDELEGCMIWLDVSKEYFINEQNFSKK